MVYPAILVVDDEPALLKTLTRAIRLFFPSVRVDTATTSDEAATAIQHRRYQIMITDYYLNGTSGSQLAAQARTLCPDLAVVLMSGGVFDERPDLHTHVDAFLAKPFELQHLTQTIQCLMSA